jgi:hypothetical protein
MVLAVLASLEIFVTGTGADDALAVSSLVIIAGQILAKEIHTSCYEVVKIQSARRWQ